MSRHCCFPTSASCGEAEKRGADVEEAAEQRGGVAVASGCSAMGDDKATELHGGDSTGRAKQDAPPGRRWRIRRRYFCVLIHVAISEFKNHQLVARRRGVGGGKRGTDTEKAVAPDGREGGERLRVKAILQTESKVPNSLQYFLTFMGRFAMIAANNTTNKEKFAV